MYIVRRPFRNYGQVVEVGTEVTPTNIKRFKNKLSERVIIEVTDATFDSWSEYFLEKFGVALQKPQLLGDKKHEDDKPFDNKKPEDKRPKTAVKPAAKAAVK